MGIVIGEGVISLRDECTGRWPVHFFRTATGTAAALMLAAAPSSAAAAAAAAQMLQPPAIGQSVADFYRARNDAPLWLSPTAGDAADQLISLLGSANIDGLYPDKYHVASLQQALEAARNGKRKQTDEAERALSDAFVTYVDDLMRDPNIGIIYVDPQ